MGTRFAAVWLNHRLLFVLQVVFMYLFNLHHTQAAFWQTARLPPAALGHVQHAVLLLPSHQVQHDMVCLKMASDLLCIVPPAQLRAFLQGSIPADLSILLSLHKCVCSRVHCLGILAAMQHIPCHHWVHAIIEPIRTQKWRSSTTASTSEHRPAQLLLHGKRAGMCASCIWRWPDSWPSTHIWWLQERLLLTRSGSRASAGSNGAFCLHLGCWT